MNVLVLAAGLLLAAPPVRAGTSTGPASGYSPAMENLLLGAVDATYNMRFAKAEALAREAMALDGEHPAPYFCLAGIAWTRYVYETDQSDPRLLPVFEGKVGELIAISERWLKKHPDDAKAMFVEASAYGISSRLLAVRKQWLRAYRHGRAAVKLARAAVKADPGYVDAYLGIGMYDYYSDLYPRFIGVLAKLVLGGNRARGIAALERVAKEGKLSKSTAKILLVEIFTEDPFGARDPERALALMRELRAQYPESALMHSAELVALFESRRFDEAVAASEDYLARVRAGRYNPIEAGKGHVALGCALWAKSDMERALEAFRSAAAVPYNGRPSRWAVWGRIRAGNLLDRLGRREEALKDYRAALAEPDRWDFHRLAKAWLSKPFASAEPGPIPPRFN